MTLDDLLVLPANGIMFSAEDEISAYGTDVDRCFDEGGQLDGAGDRLAHRRSARRRLSGVQMRLVRATRRSRRTGSWDPLALASAGAHHG